MMTSWIPNISGFLRRSQSTNEVESLSRRSLAHEARPPLTHVTALSLDSAEDPELVGETEILDTDLVRSLSENLPSRLIGSDWRQIYSTSSHGFSLSSFYRRCSTSTSGPTLLCIRDIDDNIFGALVSSPIVISEHFYGTGETFMFTATPRFRMFKWSGENPHFARGNVNHFTVGAGEGQFGLWLDSSLCQGRTQACSTYNNPPLVGDEEDGGGDFVVKTIECWAFD